MARLRLEPRIRITRTRVAFAACAALLALFATLSWLAVRTKSPTADEPLHAVAAYVKLFHADFRVDPEDPPLFGYWAMIPHDRRTLLLDKTVPSWHVMPDYLWRQWEWVIPTLYRTPENRPEPFIDRSRAMMLVWGVVLGALIAVWAGQLSGAVAAIAATALYALDPNFLGHAPLVKNDVPLALAAFALLHATWRTGERVTPFRAAWLALLAGVALNVKFSAVILVPIVAIVLLIRALMPRPWIVLGRVIASRAQKMLIALGLLVGGGLVSVGVIWVSYGVRYAPTPDPDVRLNMMLIAKAAARTELIAANPSRTPTEEEVQAKAPSLFTRSILWADGHKLLPQAWLGGLLDTYATTRIRRTYLHGDVRSVGWWYYFPLAMLYKTPLATLAALGASVVVALLMRAGKRTVGLDRWAVACIAVPLVIYGLSLVTSNLNLGLRHALVLYPFIYVLVGVVAARLWAAAPRATGAGAGVLLVALALETVRAHPNYIAFFNAAVGGPRGGIELLGDSNLDWGQDLEALREWQRRNPDTRLYLCYFGGVDPSYYVRHVPLPGNNYSDQPVQPLTEPGVIAISATHLQGIHFLDPHTPLFYQELRRRYRLIDVLGGTIYLFEYN